MSLLVPEPATPEDVLTLRQHLAARDVELAALRNLSQQVLRETDLDSLVVLACTEAWQAVGATTLVIPYLNDDRKSYTYISACGVGAEDVLGMSCSISVGMCGWVLRNQRSLLYGASTPDSVISGERWQPGMSSTALVPLFGRQRIIGGMAAMGKRGGGSFTEKDLTVLTLIANQVSVAIENAGLMAKLRAHNENLETIVVARTAALQLSNARLQVNVRELELSRRETTLAYKRARLVLDNINDAVVVINECGGVEDERSAYANELFGLSPGYTPLKAWELLQGLCEGAADWLEMGWPELQSGTLPPCIALHNFPSELSTADRDFSIRYEILPVDQVSLDGEAGFRCLMVVTDCTKERVAERAQEESRELMGLFERLSEDQGAVRRFVGEAERFLAEARSREVSVPDRKRALHTLKGVFGTFGFGSMAKMCHELETKWEEAGEPTNISNSMLATRWRRVRARIERLSDSVAPSEITLRLNEYSDLIEAVRKGETGPALLHTLEHWQYQAVRKPLLQVSRQIAFAARSTGSAPVKVRCEDNGLRLPEERWLGFWSQFVHVINNAVDHGIGPPKKRIVNGKPKFGTIVVSVEQQQSDVVVSIRDDGEGIDWERVRTKAIASSLPAQTHEELVEALFADGFSTRDRVTIHSGRGVGLGALREVVSEMGGRIEVTSERRVGTCFTFRIPEADVS